MAKGKCKATNPRGAESLQMGGGHSLLIEAISFQAKLYRSNRASTFFRAPALRGRPRYSGVDVALNASAHRSSHRAASLPSAKKPFDWREVFSNTVPRFIGNARLAQAARVQTR
jgi:hypothetical protein